jgi:hypothetical protein
MPYTSDKPQTAPSSDELRRRIPGWGADLDPKDRPAFPRQRYDPAASGAHWDFPDRQLENRPRERSIEHEMLPPVFGTSTPPKALSGVLRRYAYARYSEARAAHWLILLGADRVDAWESHLRSFATLHPDNPITQTGVLSEPSRRGFSSRVGRRRVDLRHTWMDPIIVAGPWVAAGVVTFTAARALIRRNGTSP